MSAITCPVCSVTTDPAAEWETLAICGACGASLVHDEGIIRRATAAETTTLSAEGLKVLRSARGRIARPERRQP